MLVTLASCSIIKPTVQSMASGSAGVPLLEGDSDHFKGVILKERHYAGLSVAEFTQRLEVSLKAWKEDGRRGVWLRIPSDQSELVPIAIKLGFKFHHAKPEHVMLNQWLPDDQENTLPPYASHNIGVAGFVVNDRHEVLLVQEKWLSNIKYVHWKLPGGVADPGENIWQTAIRETFEETGVRSEFVSLLCFRHMHQYRWGIDDLYFACLLRPLNTDITVNPNEIAEAKWMDVDAYLADPETAQTNRMIAQSYKDGLARGLFLQPTVYPHYIQGRPDQVMYFNKSCDQAPKSHDIEEQPKANI